jgi:hypothetical protein
MESSTGDGTLYSAKQRGARTGVCKSARSYHRRAAQNQWKGRLRADESSSNAWIWGHRPTSVRRCTRPEARPRLGFTLVANTLMRTAGQCILSKSSQVLPALTLARLGGLAAFQWPPLTDHHMHPICPVCRLGGLRTFEVQFQMTITWKE